MKDINRKPSKENIGLQNIHVLGFRQGILTSHKLKRIHEQEVFKKAHLKQFKSLTNREVEIIKLLVKGFNNPQIAEHLFISRSTVEQHRKNINRKLGTSSITKLFQYALAFDLI